jgi:hypothetical protein
MIDVSNEIEFKNGKGNPFGWSTSEIYISDTPIGTNYCGDINITDSRYSYEIINVSPKLKRLKVYLKDDWQDSKYIENKRGIDMAEEASASEQAVELAKQLANLKELDSPKPLPEPVIEPVGAIPSGDPAPVFPAAIDHVVELRSRVEQLESALKQLVVMIGNQIGDPVASEGLKLLGGK